MAKNLENFSVIRLSSLPVLRVCRNFGLIRLHALISPSSTTYSINLHCLVHIDLNLMMSGCVGGAAPLYACSLMTLFYLHHMKGEGLILVISVIIWCGSWCLLNLPHTYAASQYLFPLRVGKTSSFSETNAEYEKK